MSETEATPLDTALHALEVTADGVNRLLREARTGNLGATTARAVDLIASNKGRLIVTGIGKSGHIARKLAATFSSTGTAAYYLHPTEASHGDLGMVDDSDVIMALSWSGETAELAVILSYAKRFKVPLIALTAGANSALAQGSSVTVLMPKVREACPHNLAPTTSTVLQLAIGDAIAMAVMAKKGFSAKDFRVFHPGGKLGSQLRRVSDIMHRPPLPLIVEGAVMSDALLAMSSGTFGSVGIVDVEGRLTGVITDGDLRRFMNSGMGSHISAAMLDKPVTEVMTRNPVTVNGSIFASEALEILQSRKISVLFVIEDGRPVGIIHTLDLLNVGIR